MDRKVGVASVRRMGHRIIWATCPQALGYFISPLRGSGGRSWESLISVGSDLELSGDSAPEVPLHKCLPPSVGAFAARHEWLMTRTYAYSGLGEILSQKLTRVGVFDGGNGLGRTLSDQPPSCFTALRSQVDNPISAFDDV